MPKLYGYGESDAYFDYMKCTFVAIMFNPHGPPLCFHAPPSLTTCQPPLSTPTQDLIHLDKALVYIPYLWILISKIET